MFIGQILEAICKLIPALWWPGKFWSILDLFKAWKSLPVSNEKDTEQCYLGVCCSSQNINKHYGYLRAVNRHRKYEWEMMHTQLDL